MMDRSKSKGDSENGGGIPMTESGMLSNSKTFGGSSASLHVEDNDIGIVEEFTNRVMKVDDETWKNLKKMQIDEHAGQDYFIRGGSQADIQSLQSTLHARGRSCLNIPVMSAVNPVAIFWSFVTFLLDATYTSFLLPVFIAFLNYSDYKGWADVIDLIAGALFTIDLFLNFHISYYVKNKGQILDVHDGSLIAQFYIRKGPFFLDFIMVVTFLLQVLTYTLADGETAKVLTWVVLFFRLLRMARVLKFIQLAFMNSMTQSRNFMDPTLLHFTSLLFTTSVIVNFVGCTWYFVSERAINYGYSSDESPESWIVGYLGLDEPLKQELLDMLKHRIFHLWLGSVYFSLTTVTTVGYGDISGQNDAERICSMFIFLVGVIFFSFLISSVTELLANATKAQRRAQKMGEKLQSLKEWMQHRHLPKRLRYKLNRFYNEVYIQKQEDQEEEFLSEVPCMLRSEVSYFLTKQVMEKVVLFDYLHEEFLRQFASRFSSIFLAEGESIFMEGDEADALYILDDGIVEISYKMHKYGKVKAPAVIGEQCLVAKEDPMLEQYLSSVHSVTQSRLWRLHLDDIEKLWQLTPDLERQFREGLDELVLQKMQTLSPNIRDKVRQKILSMRADGEDFHQNLPIDGALLKMIDVLRLEQQMAHLSHPFPSVEFDEAPQSYVSVNLREAEGATELQTKTLSSKLTRQAKRIKSATVREMEAEDTE